MTFWLSSETVDFYDLFNAYLQRSGISQAAFARQAGCTSVFINKLSRRNKLPPLDRMLLWASHLGLNQVETEQFILEANYTHMPKAMADLLRGLIQVRDDIRARLPGLERAAERLGVLEAENKDLRERLARYEPAP